MRTPKLVAGFTLGFCFIVGIVYGGCAERQLGDSPTIAGVNVPKNVDCEEDEVIGFDGKGNNKISCIHIDTLKGE